MELFCGVVGTCRPADRRGPGSAFVISSYIQTSSVVTVKHLFHVTNTTFFFGSAISADGPGHSIAESLNADGKMIFIDFIPLTHVVLIYNERPITTNFWD